MRLTIIRGLPGTGKSTYASDLALETGALFVEADMFRVRDGRYRFDMDELPLCISAANAVMRKAAKLGADVIVAGVFTKTSHIDDIIKQCRNVAPGGRVEVRVVRMCKVYGTIHPMPKHVIDRMALQFHPYEGEERIDDERE